MRKILLSILGTLVFASAFKENSLVDKIYNYISLENEIYYSESIEGVEEQPIINETNTVYITTHGEKYHRGSCRYLLYTKEEISLDKAKKSGYTPCSVCDP